MYPHSLHDDYINLQMYQSNLLKRHGDYSKIQDDGLLYKFNKIHQRLEELKYLLGMEREQLEKERWQTHSLYSIPNKEISQRPSIYHPHESYSYPSAYAGANAPVSTVVDWTNYVVTPNYEYEGYINDLPPNLCSTFFRRNTNEIRGDPRTIGLYRGHLEDVEKMCNQELLNMENSLMNLRRIRRDWNCNELHAAIAPTSRKTKHVRRKKVYYYKDYY
ncbi:hypothetical protein QE152_g14344 [Popillia japonica]|uniref:Uncharacterized protein n=1 Tax=Popillia japonica TaxID=7064 RepID=A0AAW1L9P0_POPJA